MDHRFQEVFFWKKMGGMGGMGLFPTALLLWVTWRLHAHDTFALPYLQWSRSRRSQPGRLFVAPCVMFWEEQKESKELCTWNFLRQKSRSIGWGLVPCQRAVPFHISDSIRCVSFSSPVLEGQSCKCFLPQTMMREMTAREIKLELLPTGTTGYYWSSGS